MMKKHDKLLLLLLALLFGCLLASCGESGRGDSVKVVATNFAVYDLMREVAGDNAEVTMLLPPATESHDYELTLADAVKIRSADLFVCVGGESEDWVVDFLESMEEGDRPVTFFAMKACETDEEDAAGGILERESDAEENEQDEHVWTSFANIERIARGGADALSAVHPGSRESVEKNLASFLEKSEALREEYAAFFGRVKEPFIAVADRFPFQYLVREWGIGYVAAFSGCSSNVEASLGTVNALVEAVREHRLSAVLKIELSDGRCAEAVARETGCRVLTLESGHNVTREQLEAGVTLLDLMKSNLDVLKTVMQ